jgi:hypothetical protein
MNQRAFIRAAVAGGTIASIVFALGCGTSNPDGQDDGNGGGGGPDYSSDGGLTPPPPEMPARFTVTLVPDGVTGAQRVNFAVPFARGEITDERMLEVTAGGEELPAARRVLAKYADGSARSIQLQVDVAVSTTPSLTIDVGVAGATGSEMANVASTLAGSGTNVHPKVWVQLPQSVLLASGLMGPMVAEQDLAGTPLDAWSSVCDYDRWDTDNFLVKWQASRDVWLYDRVTTMYRGYAFTGELSPLRSAYREADIYRAGMTISNGVATNIAVPTAQTDLKYYYAQGMALHYLLTGDDRYREAAEAVSAKIATMFNPVYNGADRFWTERHAGFTLLAHEWALAVTDDKADAIAARSEAAVSAYLDGQMRYPAGYTDQNARCFAHSAAAHGEGFGYDGCSPWMSAILADGLDEYARRVGGMRAEQVGQALVRLGRIIARDGRDSTGKPFYWMGVGTTRDEIDDYDEHWGESAYIVAMAWSYGGRTDAALRTAADELVEGLKDHGIAGQTRSFNWQCRSAVMTPAFLQ